MAQIQSNSASLGMAPAGTAQQGAAQQGAAGQDAGQQGAIPSILTLASGGQGAAAGAPAAGGIAGGEVQAQGQVAGASTGGAAGTAAAGATATGAPGGPIAPPSNFLLNTMKWGGTAAAAGGVALSIRGFMRGAAAAAAGEAGKGVGLMKWGGLAAALGGGLMAGIGFSQSGAIKGAAAKEQEDLKFAQQYDQQAQAAIAKLNAEHDQELAKLQAQAQQGAGGAAAQGSGAVGDPAAGGVDPQTGQPIAGQGGMTKEQVEAAAQQSGVTDTNGDGKITAEDAMAGGTRQPIVDLPAGVGPAPQNPAAGTAAGGQVGATGVGASQGTAAAWSPNSLAGHTVQLAAGANTEGTTIAEPGTYTIAQAVGSGEGYATLDEANAAVRATMDTETSGVRFLRWLVVEHDGKFYGAIAKKDDTGGQAKPLGAGDGTVAAWNSIDHVVNGAAGGWQAYGWSAQRGSESHLVGYGAKPYSGAGAAPQQAVPTGAPAGATPAGSGTTPGSTVTGGGPVAGAQPQAPGAAPTGAQAQPAITTTAGGPARPFEPTAVLGRTFPINASTTAEGDIVRGGSLQIQGFVDTSVGGFGTAEEAAVAARQARSTAAGSATPWTRWVSLKGDDGRFYVYQASIVKRETAPLEGAAPMHVFGTGFASYYDGGTSSWKSLREA